MVEPLAVSGRAMKVLILADSRSFHTERYLAELQRQGCETLLVSLESGSIEHHLLKRRGPFRVLHYTLAAAEVRSVIDSFCPDVVNPHFASGYGHLAALALRGSDRPMLLYLWGSDILIAPKKSLPHRRKTRMALERADVVVGDSDFLLDEAARIGRLKSRRTITWGLEKDCLRFFSDRENLQQPLRIIVPRPHEQVYNNMFIVRALADLVNGGRVELTFPDFGGQVDSFKSTASVLVGDRLKFHTKMIRPEYLRYAAEHDVYLSAAWSDSSPASLLEAMGLGLIPVVGDIPGVREWVTPQSGYLFDMEHETSLVEIITQLIETDDDHALMRRSNRERIEQKAVFEDNIAEAIGIMRELCKEGEEESA